MTMTDKRPTAKPKIHRRHRAAVIESCAIAVAGIYLLALTPIPTYLALAALLVGGVAAALTVQALADSAHLGSSVAMWVLVATGWTAYERVSRLPYAADTIAGLLFPAMVLTGATLAAYADVKAERRRQAAEARKRAAAAELAVWGQIFERLGVEGVTASKETSSRGGRSVTLRMPSSGKVTIKALIAKQDGVAAAMKPKPLPPGAVWFEPGRHAAEVIMHLDDNDVLSEALPLPDDTSPLSILDALPVGKTGEGDEVRVLFREVAVLVLGIMGAGKTNLLNVILSQLARCDDVVIFVIDLKGGRLPAPWVQPWIDGDCPRPLIDWCATTRGEAKKVLDAVDRVITARGASLAGGSKITPSRNNPQYVVLVDEAGDLFEELSYAQQGDGPSKLDFVRLSDRITRKGRSEAVVPLWATQRGTVSKLGTGDLKSQCKLRFGLGTVTDADARLIVADDYQASRLMAQLNHPGSGVVWMPGTGTPVPAKWYRLDPDLDAAHGADDLAKLRRFAVVGGHNRPIPDPLSEQAMGEDYVRRWERSELYTLLAHQSPAAQALAVVDPPPKAEPTDAEVADAFNELMNAQGLGGGKPDPRGRMYALLAGRPNLGLSVAEIKATLDREGIGVARETIHRWLRADQDTEPPKVRKTGEGDGARYLLAGPQ